jgi:hypothetical protein
MALTALPSRPQGHRRLAAAGMGRRLPPRRGPPADIAAGRALGTSLRVTTEEIAAFDLGAAAPVAGTEMITWAGQDWAPAAGGWIQAPGPPPPAGEDSDPGPSLRAR